MKYIVKEEKPRGYNRSGRVVWVGHCKETATNLCKTNIDYNTYVEPIETKTGKLYL